MALPFTAEVAAGSGVCGTWEITSTPNVGNSVTRLTSVTAVSPSDAWSVGYWRNDPAGAGPVALRWDGADWNLVDLPGTAHLGSQPQTLGVDNAPNGDVWVVGHIATPPPTNNLPLVLRWRAGSWDHVGTVRLRPQTEYPFADRGGFAYEVDAIAEDDIWAVGQAAGFGDGAATSLPMAIHWDGSAWTEFDVPRISNRHHELSDVVAIASDDVWAVGDYRFIAGAFRGVTYHWDGHEWSHIPSPIEDIPQSGLEDVAATGPNDVWALGGSPDQTVLMHWDGGSWSLAEPPPHSVGGTIAAVAPNDLWVSAWDGFWHWNGAAWTHMPSDVPGAAYEIRGGAMEIVAPCTIWSVGFWTLADGITSFTLAERLRPDPAFLAGLPSPAQRCVWFPNPYRAGDAIGIAEGEPGHSVRITVHDMAGRTIRSAVLSGGSAATWSWDGLTDDGATVSPGVYVLRVRTKTSTVAEKLVLIGS